MTLVEDFPLDPFRPSLGYAASSLVPITLPWTSTIIRLGSTLAISGSKGPDEISGHLKDDTAFSTSSLQHSSLMFAPASSGQVIETTSLGASSSAEHIDFSVGASVGGSLLGVSGQVQYEKHCMQGKDVVQSSLRTSQRIGTLNFMEIPHLSSEALQLLRHSINPDQDFASSYGQYYVAGYMLGAANAVLMGANAASQSYDKSVTGHVTVKVLFIKGTKHINEQEHFRGNGATGSFSGFDTLSGWSDNRTAWDMRSYEDLRSVATENAIRGSTLGRRLGDTVARLRLDPTLRSKLSWSICEDLCRHGLVYELLLLPYAKLSEYIEAVLSNEERGSSNGPH